MPWLPLLLLRVPLSWWNIFDSVWVGPGLHSNFMVVSEGIHAYVSDERGLGREGATAG